MKQVVFIVGPTAIGKTAVSCLLAKELNAEIISCDSMLIYREPAIITAKPSPDTLKEIKHHFIGEISVQQPYSVFDYYLKAKKKIISLYNQGSATIACGGSGLYIKAILDGIFQGPGKDENLRQKLKEHALEHGVEYLFKELERIDSESAGKISSSDLKRVIRALEVYYLSGVKISEKKKESCGIWGELSIRVFGLKMKRESLYDRINRRVDVMFNQGVVDEVKRLRKLKLSITAKKIIGMKEIKDFIEGKVSQADVKEDIKRNTRRFAKRQITWFKKDKRIEWIDVDGLTIEQIKNKIIMQL